MMNWNPASNFMQDLKIVLEQLEGKHYKAGEPNGVRSCITTSRFS